MKLFLLIIPLLFLTSKAFCSFKPAEGLLNELDTASGTHRIDILNELAEMYLANSISKSIDFSTKAFQEGLRINYTLGWCRGLGNVFARIERYNNKLLSQQLKDFINYLINNSDNLILIQELSISLGRYHTSKNEFEVAAKYFMKSLELSEKNSNYLDLAYCYRWVGWFYNYIQDYDLSSDKYHEAFKLYLTNRDTTNYLNNVFFGIEAMISAKKDSFYNHELNIISNILSKYNDSLAQGYFNKINAIISLSNNNIDSAKSNLKEAAKIFNSNSAYQYLGDTYTILAHIFSENKLYDSSMYYNNLSLKIRQKHGDIRNIISSQINIAIDYYTIGDIVKSLSLLKLNSQQSLNSNIYPYYSRTLQWIYKIYKFQNNLDSAIVYFDLYSQYFENIKYEDFRRSTIKSQLKYELEKKDKDLIAMKLQDEINKNFFISIIVILVVVILIFLIIRIIQKQKHNRMLIKKNVMLESAYKELTEKEKDLQLLNSELDNLVKTRTQHLDAEIHRRGMAEENLIQLKDNLQIAYEKEKELNSLKTRFISMISHEFRTPMTIITSSVDIINMMEDNENSQKILKQSNKIKNSIKQMTSLIDEVIAFSRSEENAMNLNIEEFNLYSLSHEIIDEQKIVYKSKINISLISNFQPCYIHSDKRILRHILSNLIGNAIKYTPDDKSINIQIDQKQNLIHYTIEDRGIGIPSCDIDNIWDPFFRGHNIKSISGTGFGLYIVKEFVHRINGDIKITSNINIGTKVSLILSIKQ